MNDAVTDFSGTYRLAGPPRLLVLTRAARGVSELAGAAGQHEIVIEPSMSAGFRRLAHGCWSAVLLDADDRDDCVALVERIAQAGFRVSLLASRAPFALVSRALAAGASDVHSLPLSAAAAKEVLLACAPPRRTASCSGGRRADHARGASGAAAGLERRDMVGESEQLLAAYKTVARVADSAATVLMQGESGTGKELVARLLHAHSSRRGGPFIALNCAAVPETLLESELFGHEKGAFTGAMARRAGRFERAHGGTVFLDEVGDMSLALQAKILRVLQERELERVGGETAVPVDVRVIAATNRDLEREVAAGRFREDLYYRLAVVVLTLPPLRERGDDIRLLAEHFTTQFAREHHRPVCAIAQETLALLLAHPWPGNVRQLKNALERAVLLADGPVLLPAHLPSDIREPRTPFARSTPTTPAQGTGVTGTAGAPAPLPSSTPPQVPATAAGRIADMDPGWGAAHGEESDDGAFQPLGELEWTHIRRALVLTGGHIARAADLLGIHRNTLRRKLQEHGVAEPGALSDSARPPPADPA